MDTNAAPDWRALLAAEIASNPKGKAGAAIRLGVSRTLVSLVANGKYHGRPDAFARRVIERLHVIECPVTFQPQPRSECRKGNQGAPTHNPFAMRVWRECQTCPNKLPQETTS